MKWRRLSAGPYVKELDRYPRIDAERERELGYRARDGDMDARRELVEANLRLAFRVAMDWPTRGYGYGLIERDDLVQAANQGLMRAAADFDPGRGVKFGTYASWWIKNAIRSYCRERGTVIHIPNYLWDMIMEFYRAKGRADGESWRAIEAMGLSGHRRAKLIAALIVLGEFGVAEPERFGVNPWEPMGPVVPGPGDLDPRESVAEVMAVLSERERAVIAARYGLWGGKPRTLRDVAGECGVTWQSIQKVEKRAMRKLREAMGVSA